MRTQGLTQASGTTAGEIVDALDAIGHSLGEIASFFDQVPSIIPELRWHMDSTLVLQHMNTLVSELNIIRDRAADIQHNAAEDAHQGTFEAAHRRMQEAKAAEAEGGVDA